LRVFVVLVEILDKDYEGEIEAVLVEQIVEIECGSFQEIGVVPNNAK
jgi:hypothetical protein